MSTDERRGEILAAEEAIRQLAGELARASETRGLTEQARQAFESARQELATVAQRLSDDTRAGQDVLHQAAHRFEEARQQITRVTTEVSDAIQQVAKGFPALLDAVQQAVAAGVEETRAARTTLQQLESSLRAELRHGRRLAWAALSVALIGLIVVLLLLFLEIR